MTIDILLAPLTDAAEIDLAGEDADLEAILGHAAHQIRVVDAGEGEGLLVVQTQRSPTRPFHVSAGQLLPIAVYRRILADSTVRRVWVA